MAKKPQLKTVSPKLSTTVKNKAARLERHMKKHPNDKQSAAMVGKPRSVRKASMVKGNFPEPITRLRDGAGHIYATVEVHQPAFKAK